MQLDDDYSITKLFSSHSVCVIVDKKHFIKINIPSVKDFYDDYDFNGIYHIWTMPLNKTKELFRINLVDELQIITIIMFELGAYDAYRDYYTKFKVYLEKIIPNIIVDMQAKQLRIDDLVITPEIWKYILYILRLSCGERVEKPRSFASEDERKFWEAQQAAEERIRNIRSKNNDGGDKEGLIKMLLAITYSFPSLTIDYLFDQCMAQIQWLQENAAGAVSYEVNAKAFAAGNMKKGKKLDFFIK